MGIALVLIVIVISLQSVWSLLSEITAWLSERLMRQLVAWRVSHMRHQVDRVLDKARTKAEFRADATKPGWLVDLNRRKDQGWGLNAHIRQPVRPDWFADLQFRVEVGRRDHHAPVA